MLTLSEGLKERVAMALTTGPNPRYPMDDEAGSHGAIALYGTIGLIVGLRPDGTLWQFDADFEVPLAPVLPEFETSSLVLGTRRFPWLAEALPPRPEDAQGCQLCAGNGFLKQTSKPGVYRAHPDAREDGIVCPPCQGLGWIATQPGVQADRLPHAEPSPHSVTPLQPDTMLKRRQMLSTTPRRPWYSLVMSSVWGTFLGVLSVCIGAMLVAPANDRSRWVLLADSLPVTLFALVAVAPIVALYAAPVLWLLLRFKMARPEAAIAVAMLPALAVFLTEGPRSRLAWLSLAVAGGITVVFVWRAYWLRGRTQLPDPTDH
jgi:hypothetical protein